MSRQGCSESANPTHHTGGALKVAEKLTDTARMTICPRCQGRWSGLNTSHCTSCHQTFTGIAAFDRHRTGSHSESGEKFIDKATGEPRGPRRCLPPTEVDLVDAQRAYPCWGSADGDRRWTA